MPNQEILNAKKAVVEELVAKLQNSSAGVFVDYSGTNVAMDTELRRSMRAQNVDYAVVKNTLVRIAADQVGYSELDPILNGTTALAVSADDPVAAAKVVCEYAKKPNSTIKIKAGFVDGKVISAAEVQALADLPSREVLVATVLGTMIAPVTGFVNVLNANIRGLAVALQAIADQKSA